MNNLKNKSFFLFALILFYSPLVASDLQPDQLSRQPIKRSLSNPTTLSEKYKFDNCDCEETETVKSFNKQLHHHDKNIAKESLLTAGAIGASLVAIQHMGKPLQNAMARLGPHSSRVFGVDDAIAGSLLSAVLGKVGESIVAATPTILLTGAGIVGAMKINRLLHAECRGKVDSLKYEMAKMIDEQEKRNQKRQKGLVDEITFMRENLKKSRTNFEKAQKKLEENFLLIGEAKQTTANLQDHIAKKVVPQMAKVLKLMEKISKRADPKGEPKKTSFKMPSPFKK